MTGEEHGRRRTQRWFAMIDRLPQDRREYYLPLGPTVPCRDNIPNGCYHRGCRIEAGALPRIAEFNAWFQDEAHYNWLRFLDTSTLVKLYWQFKLHYQETSELPVLAAVYAGVLLK